MAIPASWQNALTVPALAAPMFLASNAALTLACCESGIIGTCPALNFRDNAAFQLYLHQVESRLNAQRQEGKATAAIDPATRTIRHGARTGKIWRDVWSAGQGAGAITDIPTAAELCARLAREYAAAH